MQTTLRAALAATCLWATSSIAADLPGGGAPPLAFDVAAGSTIDSFLQTGPVAAHLVLRAGTQPRIVVAFPAGDSGVGVWFSTTREPVTWKLDERPRPIALRDEHDRPLYGIAMHASVTAPELVIKKVLLSSVRVLRDYQTYGTAPAEVEAVADQRGRTLSWARDRLDGAAGYRLTLSITHGDLKDGRIAAGPDGTIGMTVTAVTGETPLTPLAAGDLLRDPARADPRARNVLAFLSYREKFLAGSWRYDTYFGRDTLMSMRLLMPALAPRAVEDGLGSVLARLSPTGEVAHEEEIGEFAILDHRRADGTLSDAPLFDYKMIDGSFMLAPVMCAWLLEDSRGASRAAAFLAGTAGGDRRPARPVGAALVSNLRFVMQSARAFAADPQAAHLISLKAGYVWGQWRDSDDGLAQGRYPYDVNAILVPAALAAASRLYASGLLAPYVSDADRASLAQAAEFADIWRVRADAFFDVEVPNAAARRRIEAYAQSVGVSPTAALRSIGTSPVAFHALALDADAKPIPIMNSDEGFALLFETPAAGPLETDIASVMRPFPAGLMTDAGVVVANPVFAPTALWARFTNDDYHGTVIWSWQQAVLAAGLARQIERPDLPPALKERLRVAQTQLWRVIAAGRKVINSELWSWTYRHGHYEVAPFGAGRSHSDESNAAQLWSTVFLAIHPPARIPGRGQAPPGT